MILNDINSAYVGGDQVDKIYLGTDTVWEPASPQDTYFRITNRTADSGTITLTKAGSPTYNIVLRTRTNGGEWSQPVIYSETSTISIPANSYVEFDGSENNYWSDGFSNAWRISASVSHDVSGDIMTLVSGSSIYGGEFASIFSGDTNLVNASGLTLSATLANGCYEYMFNGCTSLATAPELPATTLADVCYLNMFRGCTSLTTAPVLPATTLALNCYQNMFNGCTSLTTAPALPATTLAYACYSSMFEGCTHITTAPVLSAITLIDFCYQRMFYGCSSLRYIKCLATNISATKCTSLWASSVYSSGTFVKKSSMSSWKTGSSSGIPSGWTVQNVS